MCLKKEAILYLETTRSFLDGLAIGACLRAGRYFSFSTSSSGRIFLGRL